MTKSYRHAKASLSECLNGYPKIAQRINQWKVESLQRKQTFLYLCGPVGTGKSYLAQALYKYMKHRVDTSQQFHEREFLKKVRDGINRGWDYYASVEYYCDYQLMCFDDLGKGQLTEWQKEVIFSFIDERYNACQPTIITSNLGKKGLEAVFGTTHGPPIADRIFAKDSTNISFEDMPNWRA